MAEKHRNKAFADRIGKGVDIIRNIKKILLLCFLALMMFTLKLAVSQPARVKTASFTSAGNYAAQVNAEKKDYIGKSILPENLQAIEQEAFEGTALVNIVLPGNVKVIGDRAFADIPHLYEVSIPGSVEVIGEDAFESDTLRSLSGFDGSYAQKWAGRNGIGFTVLEEIRKRKETYAAVYFADGNLTSPGISSAYRMIADQERNEQNKGRPAEELKASLYTGKDSVYVQSRYFP